MMYQCGSCAWGGDSAGFEGWTLRGSIGDDDVIRFDRPQKDETNATSPWVSPRFSPSAAIASWNCDTPGRSGIEVELQIRATDGSLSGWFTMGRWSSEPGVPRGSVAGQASGGVSILTDTLVSNALFEALRVRVTPYGEAGPTVRRVGLTWSEPKPAQWAVPQTAGPGAGAPVVIRGVPECSQMIYANGGNTWCSPVSLAMVMGYWRGGTACQALVEETRDGVFDQVYGGYGNWAFNVAWAGSLGFVAQVVRFGSLAATRPWIECGAPLILSVSWDNDGGRPLSGAPVRSSNGHLTVLVGFDADGRAVMNEPASPDDASVRRTYDASELERCWMTASGGAAYVVYPSGHPVPDLGGGYTVSTAS